jgi:tryptophan 7-halogenase
LGNPVKKVVIVGRDAAAWLSALALQQSFGRTGVEVVLVELPSALRRQDAYVTLPSQQAFHRLLGLDEIRLLRTCSGIYSLGQRFSNWSGPAASFIHPYDTHGISLSHVDFLQYWLKARAMGLRVPLEDFSLGAVAAKQGRFVIFNESTAAFSKATYGYNLGALSYLYAIGKAALVAGLKHIVGDVRSVDVSDGRIRSVKMADDTTITGDFFVDASGVQARLIRSLEAPDNFESWSDWLPCDRQVVATGPVLKPVPAFSQVSAFRAGWLGIYPLMDRTVLVGSYASAESNDSDVLETMSALSGLRVDGEVIAEDLTPGARKHQWIGNCVAMGDSAVACDALDAVQLHMLHTGVSYLMALFPVDIDDQPEAGVYNEKMRSHAIGVRDFQAAHFKLNRRIGERFWDAARDAEVPDTLKRKIRLFGSRGIVAVEENETFQTENWHSLFIGHQLMPRAWDPQVEKVAEQEQIANFKAMLKFISSEVQAMPSLQAHLELNTPQAATDYVFG